MLFLSYLQLRSGKRNGGARGELLDPILNFWVACQFRAWGVSKRCVKVHQLLPAVNPLPLSLPSL